MATFVSRADLFGVIFWTPPLPSSRAADHVAALIEGVSIDNDCRSVRDVIRALDVCGAVATIKPDHHGDRDAWVVSAKPDTWFSARVAEIVSRVGRPPKPAAVKSVRVNITLSPDALAALDAMGGTRSGMIERMILRAG